MRKIGYSCSVTSLYEIELDKGYKISVCSLVYEPAEDSWLILELIRDRLDRQRGGLAICVDVGTGTGVQGIACLASTKVAYAILIDISPCALECAKSNIIKNKLEHQVDLAQCNRLDCVRRGDVAVYNLPYLPVSDDWAGLEGLQWGGGRGEAIAFILDAARKSFRIIGLTFSSLAGDYSELKRELKERGYELYAMRKLHVFFEDIMAMVFHRKGEYNER